MSVRRSLLAFVAAVAAIALIPASASAWAPASTAPIHPGVQTNTEGSGQCTSNFIFTEGSRHLHRPGRSLRRRPARRPTPTAASPQSLPLGTKVDVDGASVRGTLAYSSWVTMQANGETDEETCAYNDFALVELDPVRRRQGQPVDPRLRRAAGHRHAPPPASRSTPTATRRCAAASPSSARRAAPTIEETPGGWSYSLYTVTPGIPGDSGSAFLNATGQALGTLSTVAIAPLPASNGVGDIGKELAYARANGLPGLTLENGTEPFRAKLLGLVG